MCAAGTQHVASLVSEKCGVLESVMNDSSVIAGKCVCPLSIVWDDLMMDVSRKGQATHNSLGADYVHLAVLLVRLWPEE